MGLIKVIGTKGIFQLIALFSLVMLIGYLIALYAVRTGAVIVMLGSLQSPQLVDVSYVLDVLIIWIIALLLIRRNNKLNKTILFRFLEVIVVGFTSFFAFLLVLIMILPGPTNIQAYYITAGVAAIFFVILKELFPILRDLATIVSSIGVGLVLGFNFSFEYALIILAAVALYDYIAVFKTHEMVKLAHALSTEDMSFLLSISDMEYVPVTSVGIKDALEYQKEAVKSHRISVPLFKESLDQGKLPIISQISLGEGDLCLPLMAIVSATYFVGNTNFTYGLIVAAIIGIGVTMMLLKRYKMPLPAIPPIFASISIFTGFALLAASGYSASVVALLIFLGAIVMAVDIAAAVRKAPKMKTGLRVYRAHEFARSR